MIDITVRAIKCDPKTFPFGYKKELRGFVTRRFPYLILYILDNDNIIVFSVFNTRQNPERLKGRVI